MLRTAFTDTWEEIDSFWFHRLVIIDKDYCQLLLRLLGGSDKSFVDDLVASGYCKHESNLCVARCWGLSLVSMICSSLLFEFKNGFGRSVIVVLIVAVGASIFFLKMETVDVSKVTTRSFEFLKTLFSVFESFDCAPRRSSHALTLKFQT